MRAYLRNLALVLMLGRGMPSLVHANSGGGGSYSVERDTLNSGGGRSASVSYSELGELNPVGGRDRGRVYVGAGGFVGGEPGEADIVVGALVDGVSTVDFGLVTAGCSCGARVFRIENAGTADLSGLSISRDGANAQDFTVSGLSGTTVPTGKGAVIFTVMFSPGASGPRTAAIHIANNTPGSKQSFDIQLSGTGSNSTVTTGPDAIERPNTTSVVKVQLSTLLENDTDSSGGTLSITSVGNALPAGATVTLVGGFAVYTAPGAKAGNGSFTYTLCGAPGGNPVVGTVTVTETGPADPLVGSGDSGPSQNAGRIEVKNADVVLSFIGVPYRTYGVQYTTDTSTPYTWNEFTPKVSLVAPDSGVITYTDVNPSGPLRFYRFIRRQ